MNTLERSRRSKRVVLLQFAGLGLARNEKRQQTAVKLATAKVPGIGRSPDQVVLLLAPLPSPPPKTNDPKLNAKRKRDHAEVRAKRIEVANQLLKEINRKRGRQRCRFVDLSMDSVGEKRSERTEFSLPSVDPYDVETLLERLRGHGTFGRLFDSKLHQARLLVSTATGSPGHWVALLQYFVEAACDVALISLEFEGDERRPRIIELQPERPECLEDRPGQCTSPDELLEKYAHLPFGSSVLITGKTGCGKTRFARDLHRKWCEKGLVKRKVFQAVNCANFQKELLESELFGHVKGAFTHAMTSNKGLMETCDGGTLLLDEIGEMSLELQAKFLQVLDTGRYKNQKGWVRAYRPVGGMAEKECRVRFVFATNRNLQQMVEGGRFRDDLLARISSFPVDLPVIELARHRILYVYFDRLFKIREEYGGAEFIFQRQALDQLIRFVFDPRSVWSHNYRDVLQSAERLAFEAWADKKKYSAGKDNKVTIEESVVKDEERVLRLSWQSKATTSALKTENVTEHRVQLGIPFLRGDSSDSNEEREAWARVAAALPEGAYEKLSWLERCEARLLYEAKLDTGSGAKAWVMLQERKILCGKGNNPADRFSKRWKRFETLAKDRE